VGKNEGKRALERPWGRRENNIKMYLQEVGWGMDVIYLTSGYKKVADCCGCGNETSGSTKCGGVFLTSCGTISFSGRTLLRGVSRSVS